MQKKLKVGVLFGGKSSEHEVSLLSAKNVIAGLNRDKYEPILIGIDKSGGWHLQDEADYLLNAANPKTIKLNSSSNTLSIVPAETSKPITVINKKDLLGSINVIFPVLHGPYGEDGTIQGLLKLLDIPFVGAGVLGSSIGMDKDVMKRLLRDAGLPIGNFITVNKGSKYIPSFEQACDKLGNIIFVKPANAGSSVGVSKAKNKSDYEKAIQEAFKWDKKILLEQYIEGREIECSVLGNSDPIASVPGEIVVNAEFYSYEAKYIDADGAKAVIPADLPTDVVKRIQQLAIDTFKTLECEGLGRVDFFVTKNWDIFIIEINTLPGFTNISMYPKLWEATGIGYSELLDRLIELALERDSQEKEIAKTF
jgi:D-alanine-D-alanine ligase